MLLGAMIWSYQWSRGNVSTNSVNAPVGLWVLFAIGIFFFVVGFIGSMYFIPYSDWYNY